MDLSVSTHICPPPMLFLFSWLHHTLPCTIRILLFTLFAPLFSLPVFMYPLTEYCTTHALQNNKISHLNMIFITYCMVLQGIQLGSWASMFVHSSVSVLSHSSLHCCHFQVMSFLCCPNSTSHI